MTLVWTSKGTLCEYVCLVLIWSRAHYLDKMVQYSCPSHFIIMVFCRILSLGNTNKSLWACLWVGYTMVFFDVIGYYYFILWFVISSTVIYPVTSSKFFIGTRAFIVLPTFFSEPLASLCSLVDSESYPFALLHKFRMDFFHSINSSKPYRYQAPIVLWSWLGYVKGYVLVREPAENQGYVWRILLGTSGSIEQAVYHLS